MTDKLKIAVLSDTRVPTLPVGGHGLGRLAYDIADGLFGRGHEVTLMAGPGSMWEAEAPINITPDETWRVEEWESHRVEAEAIIDLSHKHELSQKRPELPIINAIADLETTYRPPNPVVFNWWQAQGVEGARVIPLGVNEGRIPTTDTSIPGVSLAKDENQTPYVLYCAKIHPAKGYDVAMAAAEKAGVKIRFVGQRFVEDAIIPNWEGEIADNARLYRLIGGALALIAPSRQDAGGRVVIEAAMCGTPTLATDWSGTQAHVSHTVSGFVCKDVDELAEAIGDVKLLDRAKVRRWAEEYHSLGLMLDGFEQACRDVVNGVNW